MSPSVLGCSESVDLEGPWIGLYILQRDTMSATRTPDLRRRSTSSVSATVLVVQTETGVLEETEGEEHEEEDEKSSSSDFSDNDMLV